MSIPEDGARSPGCSRVPLIPRLVATAGGAGLMRPAPGTWGSVVGGILAYGCLQLCPPAMIQLVFWVLVVACSAIGTWAADVWQRSTGIHDPQQVVIDEVAGVWLALACVPPSILVASPGTASIVAVLVFRLFDIVKPWPIATCEHLPGGIGVMADDLAAGLVAGLATAALLR